MTRQTTKLVFGVFTMFFLTACSGKKNDKHHVTITISASNSADTTVQIFTNDLLIFDGIKLSESKIDKSGNSVLEFALDQAVFASWKCGNKFGRLFISPGDDLQILLDSLKYVGDGAAIDEYLVKADKIKNYDVEGGKRSRDLEPDQFLTVMDSMAQAYRSLLKSTNATHQLKKEQVKILEADIEMSLLFFQQNYLNGRFDGDLDDPQVPATMKKNLSNIPLDTIALRANSFYYGLVLSNFMRSRIHSTVYQENEDVEEDSLSLLADEHIRKSEFPEPVKEFLLAKNISDWLNMEGITLVLENVYNRFKTENRNHLYLTSLKKSHDKWLVIAPGKPAPDFSGETTNGQKTSLSDLKGKVVYVDVWATWCGPCQEQFPHSRKVEKAFEGNDKVAFLFVSIDEDVKSWKKMVSKGEVPKGIHINQRQTRQPDAIWENYHIWGIPRYILIDQEGKIVQTHAFPPSSGKVTRLINEVLNSKTIALK